MAVRIPHARTPGQGSELWRACRARPREQFPARPDGKPAFFEFTQIVVEGDQVLLRQIHVHGGFDTSPKRKDPMMPRLSAAKDNSVVFVPVDDVSTTNAADPARVTDTRKDDETLALRIESKPVKKNEGEEAPQPVVIELLMKRAW
jgi:hypothetical protein